MTIENGISQEMKVKLRNLLVKHEGERNHPYYDTLGNITIGIGRNLTGIGIREDEKELMFKNDTDFLYAYFTKTYSWFSELNEARQIAIIDMAFMGIKNFASFKRMISYLDKHDYIAAAAEILDSEYGKKYINRSRDVANIVLQGTLDGE